MTHKSGVDYSQDARCDIPPPAEVVQALGKSTERKFRRACRLLRQVLVEVQQVAPAANGYLQEDTLYIMVGPAHDGSQGVARHDRVLWSELMLRFDGGAW